MTNIIELRKMAGIVALRYNDKEVANVLLEAANDIEDLCKQIDGTVRVATSALSRLKEAGLEP